MKLLSSLALTFGSVACHFSRSVHAQVFTEDVLQLELEELGLRTISGAQYSGVGVLTSAQGVDYLVNETVPYTSLFASSSYEVSEDGASVTHKRTNETFRIPVFRSVHENNTLVQVFTEEDGTVSYAEILGEDKQFDTFFVATSMRSAANGTDGEAVNDILLSFVVDDIDTDKLDDLNLTERVPPESSRHLRELVEGSLNTTVQRQAACSKFKVVKVAFVYDSEFCGFRGSTTKTRDRIIAIAAAASTYYERDMCIKLQLTDIYTPDKTCGGTSSTFKNFNRGTLCEGTKYMLNDFSSWMASKRDAAKIDQGALVHLLTGVKPSGSIGCAWTGTLCWDRYSYGVEYTAFNTNLQPQGVLMAHEIGHNLGAQHFNDKNKKFEYIMESKISTGADGFDDTSIDSILRLLGRSDVKRCYSQIGALEEFTPTPTEASVPPTRPSPPVSPPSPAPVASPTPPLGDCYAAVLDALPTCIVEDNDDGFVCFNVKNLIPSTCKVRFYLSQECENFFNRRILADERISSSGGGKSSKGSNKRNIMVNSTDAIFAESAEANESTFGADDCNNSCLYSQKSFCFSAAEGTSHPISFVVLNDEGEQVGDTVSTTLTVEVNGSDCAVPDLRCID